MKSILIEGKPLSEFRTEVELGMPIYAHPDSQVYAQRFADGTYGIFGFKHTFDTFDELLDDSYYPDFVNASIWSTLDTSQSYAAGQKRAGEEIDHI